EQLARIHSIPPERLPFLAPRDLLAEFARELGEIGEPHPAIEYGLWWLRERRPEPLPGVVCHGDFRLGNVVVAERGLGAVLVREFIEQELLPVVDDRRLRFRMLVAMNALAIAARELAAGDEGPSAEELWALVERIREGDPPPLDILKEHVEAKLRVASPRFLEN